jgi:hypothetical protein
MIHDSGPPRIGDILRILDGEQVRYVIAGSVAARLHGVDLEAQDLDIVPATDTTNLKRLVRTLQVLEARPPGPFGQWLPSSDGEVKWVARRTTEEEILAWAPNVHDVSSFDHAYRTRFGNLDIVPSVAGTYEVLKRRAVQIPADGCNPWVAHIDEVLARLTVPRRTKDAFRVSQLREIQRVRGGVPDA